MKTCLAAVLLVVLAACALPQTTVKTGAAPPALFVIGAPLGAMLYVDGLVMGPAKSYDGKPNVLAVLEGAHQVEVRQGDAKLFSDKVFVSNGETHAITLEPGATK